MLDEVTRSKASEVMLGKVARGKAGEAILDEATYGKAGYACQDLCQGGHVEEESKHGFSRGGIIWNGGTFKKLLRRFDITTRH